MLKVSKKNLSTIRLEQPHLFTGMGKWGYASGWLQVILHVGNTERNFI